MQEVREVKKEKVKKYRGGILLKLALLCFAGFIVISLVHQQLQIAQKREELSAMEEQVETQNAKNEELRYTLENEENKDELMEQEARRKYDFAKPNEEIFVDIGGNS